MDRRKEEETERGGREGERERENTESLLSMNNIRHQYNNTQYNT